MAEPIDLTRFYIPHDYVVISEMYGAKQVINTFAPLPCVIAHYHATGNFPKACHEKKEEIIPTPGELLRGAWSFEATD